jgi:hypothetical protein
MTINKIIYNMLQYFDFVLFHCILLAVDFFKLGMKILLFAISQFRIVSFSVILFNGNGYRKNS